MPTEIRSAIPFDESGNTLHVITKDSEDYAADSITFETRGVTLQRNTVDIVFVPYENLARVYQEL